LKELLVETAVRAARYAGAIGDRNIAPRLKNIARLENLGGMLFENPSDPNFNTGNFDPAKEICSRAREAGAWVHVDGAFGLCGAVSPLYAPLLEGVSDVDSWAIDCHEWLNVPYDSGMGFSARARAPTARVVVRQ
jgi:pyridoxal-dependent decarboxylase-like protein